VPILESAEIRHALLRMMTVYELERLIGTSQTHKRCRSNLDGAMGQVEQLIRRGWGRPALLREDGDELSDALV
jgi:chromosome partitioning protein